MQLEGVTGAPYKHPEVRRKMPAPHSRERIDLGGGIAVKRAWKQTAVTDIRSGDTVADFGRVHIFQTYLDPNDDYAWLVKLTNVFGVIREFPGYTSVLAYTPEKKTGV